MCVIPLRLKERYAKQIGNGEESRRGITYERGTENTIPIIVVVNIERLVKCLRS